MPFHSQRVGGVLVVALGQALQKYDPLIVEIASAAGAVGLIIGYASGAASVNNSSSATATMRTEVSKGGVMPVPGDSDAIKAMKI